MADNTQKASDTGGGTKIFLIIILALTVFILILLLLMTLRVLPVGTGARTTDTSSGTPSAGSICEPPSSGNRDGATCTCEENDCSDGIDNDNDGLTDCRDPDCDCLPPNCPECDPCDNQTKPCVTDCGTWPNCGGKCRTTSGDTGICSQGDNKCCVCKPDTVSCEDSLQSQCTGVCPDDQNCVYKPAATLTAYSPARCECEPKQNDECGQGDYPTCGGTCPTGEECVPVTAATTANLGSCQCQPVTTPCAQSGAPTCGGDCPKGEVCRPYTPATANIQSCRCVRESTTTTVDCEDSLVPACVGTCGTGFHCASLLSAAICGCVPDKENDCDDQRDNDGDGAIDCADSDCEDDPVCAPDCGQTDAPACNGKCDEGLECVSYTSPTANIPYCRCEPISNPCGANDYPNCDADCPEGETCTLNRDEQTCECQQGCTDITNPKYCYQGACPQGYECQDIRGACECKRSCGSGLYPNSCSQGYCPGGSCIADTGLGTCFCTT